MAHSVAHIAKPLDGPKVFQMDLNFNYCFFNRDDFFLAEDKVCYFQNRVTAGINYQVSWKFQLFVLHCFIADLP